jgi:hypothetical protein
MVYRNIEGINRCGRWRYYPGNSQRLLLGGNHAKHKLVVVVV